MKKEENLELLKKLAKSKIDTTLYRSSKSLGVGTESKRNTLFRTLRRERTGIDPQVGHKILYDVQGKSDENSEDSVEVDRPLLEDHGKVCVNKTSPRPLIGSGLKRPFDISQDGNPLVKKRKQDRKPRTHFVQREIEPPWDGFDSTSDPEVYVGSVASNSESTGTQTDVSLEDHLESLASSASNEDEDTDVSFESFNEERQSERKKRSSIFKAWATQQVNEALGFAPTVAVTGSIGEESKAKLVSFKHRQAEEEPLPAELTATSRNSFHKAFNVTVDRSKSIQDGRLELPAVAEEQKIMEAIHNNSIVVIWGATGSGKTTQVPQFLFEAGYGSSKGPTPGMIGVTQPRRVAAVSMAKRVGDELGSASEKVAYQIRFESTISTHTAIKFMTDGILVREIAEDFLLSKYSAIIIDEAHERSTNTDILIGMVSRIVDLRESTSQKDLAVKPLKLIIMSATLRISDFTDNRNLFRNGPPPLLQAEGRQYPISIHFAKRTQRDYMEEMFLKISKGHKKLPPGGMLVFLTGQNEISSLAKRLKQAFENSQTHEGNTSHVRIAATDAPLEVDDVDIGDHSQFYERTSSDADGISDSSEDPEEREFDVGDTAAASSAVRVLPLYSQLPTKEQLRIFEPVSENTRLIVLATNVAETSLTIPDIRYVFDCGRAKEKKFDRVTGIQRFEVGWISKSSASQRAGRAGRSGPGHCYRLYSSAVYERDFNEHAEPEILRMPVEGIVLQLKSMDLQHVVNFPFPTPPDRDSLIKAERLLGYLGALNRNGKVTAVGRDLSIYPLSPRFSKILLIGHQHECMPYTIALVAALVVRDIFLPENQLDLNRSCREQEGERTYTTVDRVEDTAREQRKRDYNKAHHLFSARSPTSDALKLLSVICAYAYASKNDQESFCAEMFLRPKALLEASQLRRQLTDIVRLNRPGLVASYEPRLPEPSEKQLRALQQILAAGFIDQVAIRADLASTPLEARRKPKRAIDVPYLTLFPSHSGKVEEIDDKAVYLHPSSVMTHLAVKQLPQYVIYSHLQRSTPSTVSGSKPSKVRMHALTAISGNQLAALARWTPLLEYGKPVGKVVQSERLEGKGEGRECWVVPNLVGEKGTTGWPLPVQKVVQRKDGKGVWEVEKVLA